MLLLAPETEPLRVALTVDDRGLHRRRVWENWQAQGRTSRWGALVGLGVKIRAHPHPDRLEPYRAPPPAGVKFVPECPGGGHDCRGCTAPPRARSTPGRAGRKFPVVH